MTDAHETLLFQPLTIRGVTLRNRIGMSPMCQYSSREGMANNWHHTHLVSRAVGGVGIVFTEAAAVVPAGRISPEDLGIWSDAHAEALAPIVADLHAHGAAAAIQLAHAGRKASTRRPWETDGRAVIAADEPDGWQVDGPSPIAYDAEHQVPHELTVAEIDGLVAAFVDAAVRSVDAGFDVVELHGAHGYLIHEFLSPLSNERSDAYGGDFDGRVRFLLELTRAVRAAIPEDRVLAVRLSATDHVPGGWALEDTVRLAGVLREAGVDLVDCSSGGAHPDQVIRPTPGYQVPYARAVRATGIATAAVGIITEPSQAEALLRHGDCDIVLLGRELLRSPYWPRSAALELGVGMVAAGLVPPQYLRAVRQR